MTSACIALELIKHPEARMVRQAYVQHDGARIKFLRKRQRLGRASGDQAFELHLAGEIPEDCRETLIVLDDEEHAPLARELFTVVLDPTGRLTIVRRRRNRLQRLRRKCVGGRPSRLLPRLHSRGAIGIRNEHGERAAHALNTSERERSTKQADKLSADRQSKASAPVLSADRSVSLPKGLKNNLLFVLGNADARVRDRERNLTIGRAPDAQLHLALFGEFECVRKQIPQNLFKSLPVGLNMVRALGVDLDPELQILLFGDRSEEVREISGQPGDRNGLGLDLHMARLDLRKVENVVDERQQIVAGRTNRLSVSHLL